MQTEIEEYSREVYKLDSSGKVRILHVYTEGADLVQESGLLDGKRVEHRSTATAKNVGRANETTPEEQAQSEAESLIVNKMSTGYFNTIEEAKANIVLLPMLAKPWDAKRIDWTKNVFIQPKLDGMRCFAIVTEGKCELYSRKGKLIDTCQHIIDAIEAIPGITTTVLDGELYAHGKTFQENMKLIKKYREGETEDVHLHIYDTVEDKSYEVRYRALNLVTKIANTPILELVPCDKIGSETQIAGFHTANLAAGYEGSIIRHGDDGYKLNKRANQLLKYKDFIDIACKVIDIKPSKKRPEHGECVCEHNGHTFGTGMKFSHKERAEILVNKDDYIGQTAEIRFFEYTDDGVPRFPVCVGFRLDK
jgi:DNA ligase-1